MPDVLYDIAKIVGTAAVTTGTTLLGVRQALRINQADAVIDHLDECVMVAQRVVRKISNGDTPTADSVDDWQDAFSKLSRDAQRRFAHTTGMGAARTALSDLDMVLQAADPTSRDVVQKGEGAEATAALQQSQASCKKALVTCARELWGYGIWGKHGR